MYNRCYGPRAETQRGPQGVCLIGMHAFTGCDTVSSFAGKGKITALRLVKQQTFYQEIFKHLGVEWVLPDVLFQSLQEFTCKLYCSQPGTDNINELRYRLFCAKGILVQVCVSRQWIPTPIGSGWREDSDHFTIDWMSGDCGVLWISGTMKSGHVAERVCVHGCMSRSSKGDFVLLELFTLAASRNTTVTQPLKLC